MSERQTFSEAEIRDMEQAARYRQQQEDEKKANASTEPPYSGSRSVESLPDAPPEPPAPAPPEPAPARGLNWKRAGERLKTAAKVIGSAAMPAVAGGISALGDNTEDTGEGVTQEQLDARTKAAAAPKGPPPPATEEDGDEEGAGDGQNFGSASGASGASGTLIPGGMEPYTQKRDVKYGKPVAPGVREATGEAGRLDMEAANIDREANARLYQHEHDAAMMRVHANEEAAAAQQRLAEERDRIVASRLAEIETLNKKAMGEPGDIWSAPHVFARMAGFLALAVGTYTVAKGGKGAAAGIPIAMSGSFLNGLINEDIQSKLNDRRAAGAQAGRQINLLHLHEQQLGSQSKAIEATRMAYYDNILQQMDAYKADHRGEVNEGNFDNLRAQILREQATAANNMAKQEAADVTDELVNKYRKPEVVSGAGPEFSEKPNVIRLDDGTAWSLGEKEMAQQAAGRIQALQRVKDINARIMKLRQETYALSSVPGTEGHDQYKKNIAILQTLESQKGPLMQKSLDGSVLRETEQRRFQETDALATKDLSIMARATGPINKSDAAATDAALDAQQSLIAQAQHAEAMANGKRVVQGYVTNKYGQKRPVDEYTGQNFAPRKGGLAPHGFRADNGKPRTTEDASTAETEPQGADFGFDRESLPAPAAHHKKKKKK